MQDIDRRTAAGYRAFQELERLLDTEYRQATLYRRRYEDYSQEIVRDQDRVVWERGRRLLSEALSELRVARYLIRQLLINMDDWRRRRDRGEPVGAAAALPEYPQGGNGHAGGSENPAEHVEAPSSS